MAYCRWLSVQLGADIRLPTEQQWERAARGRKGAEYHWGAGYQAGQANCNEKFDKLEGGVALGRTTAVGIYPFAGPEGVHDLAGNVWEWCLNEYNQGPSQVATAGEKSRVLRGGSWRYNRWSLCATNRRDDHPVNRDSNIGFRVCRVSLIEKRHNGALDAGPPVR